MVAETDVREQAKRGVGRRGVIAGAAALAAALIAKQASAPVEAADGGTVTIGSGGDANNTFTTRTTMTSTVATTPATAGFRVRGTSGVAVPDTTNDAIQGYTQAAQNAGLLGRNDDLDGVGAAGIASNGTGVYGQSTTGSAFGGRSTSGAAVYGVSTSGYGTYAQSGSNIGLYALSSGSYGVLGITTAGAPYSGLTGIANTSGAAAFAGGTSNAAAYAAYFTGKVNIDGPFLVNGTQRFTLKHADGTSRLVAGALTVEPMVEDFGKGTLANGSASIALDADFRDVADTGDYHVFLTSRDAACKGLAVANQDATGFVVQELNGGASSGAFSYRIVAKPKDGGGKIARMAKYEQPQIALPGINAPIPAKAAGGPNPLPNAKGTGSGGSASAPVAPAPPVVRTSDPSPAPSAQAPAASPPSAAASDTSAPTPNPIPGRR